MSAAAWSDYWAQAAHGACLPETPAVRGRLAQAWGQWAAALAPGAAVLDLACGKGEVAHRLLDARPDLRLTGVDAARIAASAREGLTLLDRTPLEALPFDQPRFDAAASQFGVEYADPTAVGPRLAAALHPGAPLLFIAHHARSAVVQDTAERAAVLDALADAGVAAAFEAGDRPALVSAVLAVRAAHPRHARLVDEIARGLGQAIVAGTDRADIWQGFLAKARTERAIAAALQRAAVDDAEAWLARFGPQVAAGRCRVIEVAGAPVAWQCHAVRA
ncbi:methyltransferase domain-containing protein [Sphingomicrobium astaxanthinifaciens]|uniref:methyltransferase domain-containing protein n=1 Tax=Sphingomicrobium astaxanthinifaciens TaxID=1227949 RepID=UPI001FCA4AA7|nr:class I SAM-dependent methyltransferase [Sphingomicrobium astaxanthinifaciens]MCJ7421403.1 class I SAM-dependent methyltransferase [Sphingomicrobium astaxanthinifaciens]